MLRALAEWAMKGRKQAALVAAIAALLPLFYWISAATVALVTLRRGQSSGAETLAWALLPAGVWAYSVSDPTPFAVIAGTYLLAVALRETIAWEKVLMLALPIGAIAGIGMGLVLGSYLDEVVEQAYKLLTQSANQGNQAAEAMVVDQELIKQFLLGGLASVHTAMMLVSLILARSWQAGMFNPGGFRQEFHQLRLPISYTGTLLAITLICFQLDLEAARWLPLLLLPWIIAGIALIHGSLAKRDLGTPWLISFYCSVLFVGHIVITLLVFAAVIDSLVDFRKRIPAKN